MILVAHSGPDSFNALDWAAAEAARRKDCLTIMYVVPIPAGYVVETVTPSELSLGAEEILQIATDRAREAGVEQIETITGYRSVAGALVEVSREADLLVVGHRGHGPAASALLGSVAYAVTSHAACPVVVVRGDGSRDINKGHPIVVGIDGSRSGVHAAHFAADLAQSTGADLKIIGVWDVRDFGGFSHEFAHRVGIEVQHSSNETKMRGWIDLALTRLTERYPDVNITGECIQGSAVVELLAAGHRAGLIVVGTRGRGGFAGLLLGSTSHRLIHDATCPVAVIR